MDSLKEVIRNLAFILLFATFLELLLPNKSMRGFVQLVMGLFVIAAIMNPLASFLSIDYQNNVPAWFTASSGDLPVLAAEGGNIENSNKLILQQYQKILVSQIRTLVLTVDDIKEVEVELALDSTVSGFYDYPQIIKVDILVSRSKGGISAIEPVIIGDDKDTKFVESELALDIKKRIASFMQIPEDIIKVSEKL